MVTASAPSASAASRGEAEDRGLARDVPGHDEAAVLQARAVRPHLRAARELRAREREVGLRGGEVARRAPLRAAMRRRELRGHAERRVGGERARRRGGGSSPPTPRGTPSASAAVTPYVSSSSCSTPRPPVARRTTSTPRRAHASRVDVLGRLEPAERDRRHAPAVQAQGRRPRRRARERSSAPSTAMFHAPSHAPSTMQPPAPRGHRQSRQGGA